MFDRFDTADLAGMVRDGSIKGVIVHKMGNVIGIGTLWGRNGVGFHNLLDTNNDYRVDTRATNVWRMIGVVMIHRQLQKALANQEQTSLTGTRVAFVMY